MFSVANLAQVISQSGTLRRPRLAEQVGIILRPTVVSSLLYGIADMASLLPPSDYITIYNPNGGSGVPPIFYKGPRGPSPTVGGALQGPRCMWWGSPH